MTAAGDVARAARALGPPRDTVIGMERFDPPPTTTI
jgi:hypothetical protein